MAASTIENSQITSQKLRVPLAPDSRPSTPAASPKRLAMFFSTDSNLEDRSKSALSEATHGVPKPCGEDMTKGGRGGMAWVK